MFNPVNPKVSFPALEEETLAFWERNAIFQKSLALREGADEFVFYDGPPFATGLPHFGHFVPGTIKDIIPRYQTMKGKKVERRFGWDCHGLPVENLVEKELGLGSKTEIERYGVARFNEACRASVLRYTAEWRRAVTRLGRWVDFDRGYRTMDRDYMESIWAVFKALWDKKLIYEGPSVLPYCPRCATVLSNHELGLGGRPETRDPALTVRFKLRDAPPPLAGASLLAWTTTPWTLPSNLALVAGPDVEYVLVEAAGERLVLARARLDAYVPGGDGHVLGSFRGDDLRGLSYEPPFAYFARAREAGAFRVFTDGFVTTEDGTGIVHAAPGFGEDDARVLAASGIPPACPVDAECRFGPEVPDYAGRFVKDCDRDIEARLEAEGALFKSERITHPYPHCWRCGSPLIYRAVSGWFVDVRAVKTAMIEANRAISWRPAHIKEGRFGKWLEGARDWAVSRNRYWGNPIPVWKCPDCGKALCAGSAAELSALSGREIGDLHKHFVDEITIPCPDCGGTARRVSEVLDCWFESGAMPYAQSRWPFAGAADFERRFPADFIAEGLDQTRGWFYTLTVLAAALFGKPAFKNCVVSGLVLAADGKKMSKSLRNYTDPLAVVDEFGADALRLFLVSGAAAQAGEMRYGDDGPRDMLKNVILPLWSAYGFFVTYANIDGVDAAALALPDAAAFDNALDRWILSETQTLCAGVDRALADYDPGRAVAPLAAFIDGLNNWYIRRSRRRFWASGRGADKLGAYRALYAALRTLAACAAPFIPFTTEAIYRNLRRPGEPESLHLCDFPRPRSEYADAGLEYRMAAARKAAAAGHALRARENIKARRPLRLARLVTRDAAERAALAEMEPVIREELNVKEITISESEEGLVEYEAKANFRVLGKELGGAMKEAAAKIAALGRDEIAAVLEGATLRLEAGGAAFDLTREKLDVRRRGKEGFKALNAGSLTVALDTAVTDELAREGDIRDLTRAIQNRRKEAGLDVSDRIRLRLCGGPRLKTAWAELGAAVREETLAAEVLWSEEPGHTSLDSGGERWSFSLEKRPGGAASDGRPPAPET